MTTVRLSHAAALALDDMLAEIPSRLTLTPQQQSELELLAQSGGRDVDVGRSTLAALDDVLTTCNDMRLSDLVRAELEGVARGAIVEGAPRDAGSLNTPACDPIVLSANAFDRVVELIEQPAAPTETLREIMKDEPPRPNTPRL